MSLVSVLKELTDCCFTDFFRIQGYQFVYYTFAEVMGAGFIVSKADYSKALDVGQLKVNNHVG